MGLLLLLLTPIAMLTFLAAFNPDQIIDRYAARNELMTGTPLASAVIVVCVVVGGGILVFGLRGLTRRHFRKCAAAPGLGCPHCGEGLFATPFVIASQRCPTCRKRVLANPDVEAVGVAGESANR